MLSWSSRDRNLRRVTIPLIGRDTGSAAPNLKLTVHVYARAGSPLSCSKPGGAERCGTPKASRVSR